MERSVTSLFNRYVECSNLAESSVALKRRAMGFFVKAFGDIEVGSVDYGYAEDYRNYLTHGRTAQSVNIYVQNFKPFFTWLSRRGYISANPFAELSLLKVGEIKRPSYSPEEIERIIKVCDKRWSIIVLLALSSLRRSEILNLVVRDIHFDKNYILIAAKADTEATWRWDIKNHNQAITPLPETIQIADSEIYLHRLLIELIDEVGSRQPYVCVKPNYYKKLIQLKNAKKLSYEKRNCPWANFDRDFAGILRRAKVEPKRFHDLRGTFAREMIRAGLSEQETQKLMRHSSVQTTLKYYAQVEAEKLVAKSSNICKKCYATNVP